MVEDTTYFVTEHRETMPKLEASSMVASLHNVGNCYADSLGLPTVLPTSDLVCYKYHPTRQDVAAGRCTRVA